MARRISTRSARSPACINWPNDGRLQFIAQGLKRFRIDKWLSSEPPYHVHVEYLNEDDDAGVEELQGLFVGGDQHLRVDPAQPAVFRGMKFFLNRFNTHDPSPLADFAASLTTATSKGRVARYSGHRAGAGAAEESHRADQEGTGSPNSRPASANGSGEDERASAQVFSLREQLKAIQQELRHRQGRPCTADGPLPRAAGKSAGAGSGP